MQIHGRAKLETSGTAGVVSGDRAHCVHLLLSQINVISGRKVQVGFPMRISGRLRSSFRPSQCRAAGERGQAYAIVNICQPGSCSSAAMPYTIVCSV